jgi:hypothetical protein
MIASMRGKEHCYENTHTESFPKQERLWKYIKLAGSEIKHF